MDTKLVAMAALLAWADRRERLTEDRVDLVAAAWRAGVHNVAELARVARVSRDTIYADLRAREIDPKSRDAVAPAPPSPGPDPAALRQLAGLVDTVAHPAFAAAPTDPLTRVLTGTQHVLGLLADVADPPPGPEWAPEELLSSLAAQGAEITHHAQRELAGRQTPAELAQRTDYLHRAALHTGRRASATEVTLTVDTPAGGEVTVRFGTDVTGLTTVDGPLAGLDGLDHLEVRQALATLSRVVTRRLGEESFLARRKDALPGGPPIRTRVVPSNED
ncbi:hypothetical protein JOF53_007309 [Crossiella equi]|uniref:Uncharacterized protein n=1 Tax=Crossiella equi TaxID=130796 RepID=A0ABS5APV4_9PSEU|nr:hypothetical protein [Crossiella equi]MBP2478437.1 hypothetical protein [Crossiella equi]